MKKELIVRNKKAFRNCFYLNKVEVEIGEDLLKRKDTKIKEFIKKYEDYLFNVNYDQFKKFSNYLQIVIARVYHIKNELFTLYIDELGLFTDLENDYDIKVIRNHIFKHHLTVHIYVDKIIKENDCVYGFINNKKRLIYQKNLEYDNGNLDGFSIRNTIYDKELTIEEKIEKIITLAPIPFLLKIDINDIKQIECIYPFEDILILTKDGQLLGNTISANNVQEICQLTSYRTYIIFDNGDIEFYTNTLLEGVEVKSKKALSINGSFIAYLDYEKYLHITTLGSNYLGSNFDYDNCIEFSLWNIDDFTYVHDLVTNEVSLILNTGKRRILFPLEIFVWK